MGGSVGAVVSLSILFLAGGCAQSVREAEVASFQRDRAQQERIDTLNAQLALQTGDEANETAPPESSYTLGAGDLIELTILGVPELGREARVDGNGNIALPLVGEVPVGGRTVGEAEKLIAERYKRSYLRDPQVSVLVKEYASQRITILGAVNEPKVYAVQRRLNVLEALAMAGGLTKEASQKVYVTRRVQDPVSGQPLRQNLILDLDHLISGDGARGIMLGDGDVVHVPQVGVVFVEGAVAKPGVYPLEQNTTVLKAIAMAGGLNFEAKGSAIRVLRTVPETGHGEPVAQVDLDRIREQPALDFDLADGDVVVVDTSGWKAALKGFVDTTRGFFGFGYTLNR